MCSESLFAAGADRHPAGAVVARSLSDGVEGQVAVACRDAPPGRPVRAGEADHGDSVRGEGLAALNHKEADQAR